MKKRKLFTEILIVFGNLWLAEIIAGLFGITLIRVFYGNIDEELVRKVAFLLAPLILLLVIHRKNDRTIFSIRTKEIFYGILIAVVILLISYILIFMVQNFKIIHNNFSVVELLFYTAMLLNAALIEEVIIRYMILGIFIKRNKIRIGIVISSLIWAAMHLGNPSVNILPIVNIFLIGILLGGIYVKTKNLSLPFFYHFFWNFTISIIFGTNVSGIDTPSIFKISFKDYEAINPLLSGGGFGIEGSLFITLTIILITFFYRQKINL
jgi:membrane protease YdiL (CAAX protease family)